MNRFLSLGILPNVNWKNLQGKIVNSLKGSKIQQKNLRVSPKGLIYYHINMVSNSISTILERANQQINNIISIRNRILYFLYYMFGFDLYLKKFIVNCIESKDDNTCKNYKTDKVLVFDSGIYFSKIFIPYEYITVIYYSNEGICLHVFGKINNNGIDLLKSNNLTITITGNNIILLKDTILNNLYYHIKYNDIEMGAMTYIQTNKKQK